MAATLLLTKLSRFSQLFYERRRTQRTRIETCVWRSLQIVAFPGDCVLLTVTLILLTGQLLSLTSSGDELRNDTRKRYIRGGWCSGKQNRFRQMAGSNRCRDSGCLGRGCSCFFSVQSGVFRLNFQQNTASCPIFVVHQSSPWCTSNLRPRERLTMSNPHLCRQAHLTWRLDKFLSVCMLYLTPSTNFSHLLLSWNLKSHYLVHKSSHIGLYQRHTLRPYLPTVPFWYSINSFPSRSRSLKRCIPLMFTINIKIVGVA